MAVEFDHVQTLSDGGSVYTTIGVSKTLDNYNVSEIIDYLYAGVETDQFQNPIVKKTGLYKDVCTAPLKFTEYTRTLDSSDGEGVEPETLYTKVIWLYGDNVFQTAQVDFTSQSINVITNMTPQNIVIHQTSNKNTTWGNDWSTRQANNFTENGKAMDFSRRIFYQDNGAVNFDPENMTVHSHECNNIAPFLIIPVGDNYIMLNAVTTRICGGSSGNIISWGSLNNNQYDKFYHSGGSQFSFNPVCIATEPKAQTYYGYGMAYFGISANTPYSLYFQIGINFQNNSWIFAPNTFDKLCFNDIRSGVYIYADKLYKPIINSNVIIGYTDNLSETSDFDDYSYNNSNKHDVPPSPPSPSPSGDDAEAETFGWGGSEVAGMVRYYLLSQTEMEELQTFMSDANWRMDYRNCIIGMYVVPNGGLFFDAVEPTTLKFRIGLNESEGVIPQDQELDTGIDCLRISGVVNNESAVIELPRINGNFLDFEPYSKYMVYVPFCGVIPLPDYVAGKEIKVTIFPDVPTCTCTAVVTSEGRKIATAKGAYGSQLPVTSDGDGLKAASVINSLGNIIMGAGEVALGIGTGMVPLAIAGGAQMLGSGLQADLQLGQAYGYSIGASGDTSFFGAGNRCEYYVAYSKWNNPDVDDGELQTNIYGHTYGFVCNKRGVLKDFEGFTVCDNPHVYGFSCTFDEKDEIERLLREGIIIHMSEE